MATDPPTFTIEAHPPERGRRKQSVTLCGACCCCCCCIHALGSLIGAAAASTGWYNHETDEREPSAGPVYWSVFAIVAVIALIWSAAAGPGMEFGWKLIVIALLLPFGQLLISFFSFIVVLLTATEDRRPAYMRSLGRITGFSVLGGVVGFLSMVAMGVFASLIR